MGGSSGYVRLLHVTWGLPVLQPMSALAQRSVFLGIARQVQDCPLSYMYAHADCQSCTLWFVIRSSWYSSEFQIWNTKQQLTWSDYKLQSTRMTDHTRAHVTELTITYLFQPHEPAASAGECNLDIDIDALVSSRRIYLTNWMRLRRSCGAHPSFSSCSRTSYTQCSITNNNTIDIVKK